MTRIASRLVPASFGGQVAAIVLLGLALSQVLAAVLYVGLLPRWQRSLRPDAAIDKIALVVRVVESLDLSERAQTARLLSEDDFEVRFVSRSVAGSATDGTDSALRVALSRRLGKPLADVELHATDAADGPDLREADIELRGSGALAIRTRIGDEHRLGLVEEAGFAAFAFFLMAGLGAWITWVVNEPLKRFASAAERIGTDVNTPPFPEQGPLELRRVIHSFNKMQERLQLLLSDRMRMLAAISHDLRTPLTRIRLRLETGRALAEVDRIVTDIETMESMLTSTLAFVRGVEDAESAEAVDLDLLLQTVVDLITDVGGRVTYDGPGRCRYLCRPQSLMRALTNIVGNAAKYGGQARVSLHAEQQDRLTIEIADDGPGIPPEERDKVFAPFYRTESARAHDGEGIGLGLSIARSIILAHGGSIDLLDGEPLGLLVRISLPNVPGESH